MTNNIYMGLKALLKAILNTLLLIPLLSTITYADGEFAVLLHGLARSNRAMGQMEKALNKSGFTVINVDYPSTSMEIKPLSIKTLEPVITKINEANPVKIHFVTHSMGGILVRAFLSQRKVENLGRIVMLSPPNKGSEIVDTFGNLALFQWIYGPSGVQLGTKNREFFESLATQDLCLGVITGDKSWNPILSTIIPGPDDGKVSIESAKLDGMEDFLIIHENHTIITKNHEAIKETINFLKKGKFTKSSL